MPTLFIRLLGIHDDRRTAAFVSGLARSRRYDNVVSSAPSCTLMRLRNWYNMRLRAYYLVEDTIIDLFDMRKTAHFQAGFGKQYLATPF